MRLSFNPVCCKVALICNKVQQVCRVEVVHIGLLHKAIIFQQFLIAFVTIGVKNLQ